MKYFSLILMMLSALSLAPETQAASETIVLFPKMAPGEKGNIGEEQEQTQQQQGPATRRITNVSKPTITVFPASASKNRGAAVLICPGGAYNHLAYDKEGTEIAEWLNKIGVTGVVLKYRVPRRKEREKHLAPLQDAQRAMGIIRHRATEWNIDAKRIGVLGSSAGGHLAATLSNNYSRREYDLVDEADQTSCRPDFAILIYPAYLTLQDQGDRLAPELQVTSNAPPSFLVQTQDDAVRVESSLYYYLALKQSKVPVEMHLYPRGGHGYGMRPSADTVSSWPLRAEEWLKNLGILDKRK